MSKAAMSSAEAAPPPFQRTMVPEATRRHRRRVVAGLAATVGAACFVAAHGTSGGSNLFGAWPTATTTPITTPATQRPLYGVFPRPSDPFRFLPCTNATRPPLLDDADPAASWARLYEPEPARWSWGNSSSREDESGDPYAGRGLYLCGYLDVPLDWTNATADPRIARLAVTKYQVAGPGAPGAASAKSSRTIVIEPGGPGGSGTAYAWRGAEAVSRRLSGGAFDVLGWDPRGVNATQPRAACFPYDADRDRWWQLAHRYRAVAAADTLGQLAVADALAEATFRACAARLGDLGRFVGTGMVARDLEAIRAALGEPELTGYLVSYGTGIGQTYAGLFPDRVGRVVLDGTQYAPVEWQQGGFGWGSLDNVTDAWRDGFLGECLAAGPARCALAGPGDDGTTTPEALEALEARMAALLAAVAARPAVGYTAASGPSIVTYSSLVAAVYAALYQPRTWPGMAQMLADLERGNATLVAQMIDGFVWQYDPAGAAAAAGGDDACPPSSSPLVLPGSPATDELQPLVVCADSFDAPQPAGGLAWWDALWANMTAKSCIAGNSRFYDVLPCRHFAAHWPQPAGVFRGSLNASLAHPVLLVAETHDPATPLANGRRLAAEMGRANARMVVHHGYGHASTADPSACTDAALRAFVLEGAVPGADETHCFADGKPYRYGLQTGGGAESDASGALTAAPAAASSREELLAVWRDHIQDMMLWNPGLVRQRA